MSATETITLVVVAEIRLLRDCLAAFLETRDGIRVLGTATHHEEALPLLAEVEEAVVLVDVAQPSAVETVRAIVGALPQSKVVALAVPELEPEVVRWAEEGTAGYVPRDAGLQELEACIRSVARGEAPYTPRMMAALLRRLAALSSERRPQPPRTRLTLREREIAGLMREGMTNKEIASELSIEPCTVKNHVHHILEKLGVRRRSDAAAALGPVPVRTRGR